MSSRCVALVAVLGLGLAPAAASAAHRVLLLPFDNVARSAKALEAVMPAVELAVAAKGYEVVAGEVVEASLQSERVRYLDSLTTPTLKKLAAQHGAELVMVGTILSHAATRTGIGLAARLVAADGTLVWCGTAVLTTEDTRRAFGAGHVTDVGVLTRRAVSRLVEPMPAPGASSERGIRKHRGLTVPARYVARDFTRAKRRLAVLPLDNLSEDPHATRALDALVRNRLDERAELEVVEPADVRAALAAEKVRSMWGADPETLARVGKRLGTRLFVRGEIFGGVADATSPVEVYLSIVDVEASRIVWSAFHSRRASEFERALGFGAVHSAVEVADRLILEMVESLYRD